MSVRIANDGRVYLNGKAVGTWQLDENDHYFFVGEDGDCRMCLTKGELRRSFVHGPEDRNLYMEIGSKRIKIWPTTE